MVVAVDERGLEMSYKDGRTVRVEAVTKIWAAGVQASPLGRILGEQSGAEVDRAALERNLEIVPRSLLRS